MKSILVYLVPPTHKLAKTFKKIDFQLLFSRDWDIFGTNGYLRWTRLKKFFKMSKSCFFRKNHRMDPIWPSVEVQILDEWSLMKIFWKVDEIWLILIRIFHWLFSWSWFVDIWSHQRINWQKLAQNRQKSLLKWRFPGKWSIFRKNESDHEIGNWILIQNQPLLIFFIFLKKSSF